MGKLLIREQEFNVALDLPLLEKLCFRQGSSVFGDPVLFRGLQEFVVLRVLCRQSLFLLGLGVREVSCGEEISFVLSPENERAGAVASLTRVLRKVGINLQSLLKQDLLKDLASRILAAAAKQGRPNDSLGALADTCAKIL